MKKKNQPTNRLPLSPSLQKVGQLLTFWLCLLPAALFFSYYPVIKLGADQSMNFELSLSLIWLVLFDALSLVALLMLGWQTRARQPKPRNHHTKTENSKGREDRWGFNFPGVSDRRIFLLSLFPFWATLSIFWSANPLRAILTAGIIWLLFFAIFVIIFLLPLFVAARESQAPQKKRLFWTFWFTTVIVCVFCWLQAILDVAGLARSNTLLCAGCTYHSFGFPHPSGFAIEPQFMGNLLLAPTLTVLYILLWRRERLTSRQAYLLVASVIFFSATLFFTFSRGAIYAFAIAIIIFLIVSLVQRRFRFLLPIVPVVAFLVALAAQGAFAALGPTTETFSSALTKSIHQLSLGLIDLRSTSVTDSSETSAVDRSALDTASGELTTDSDTSASPDSVTSIDDSSPESAIFSGYVAESTDYRLLLNRVAFDVWRSDPKILFFGVGLGGAGTAMHEFSPLEVTSPKEIVQSEPFSLLVELGLFGILLLVFEFLLIFFPAIFPAKFIDGRVATAKRVRNNFWHHPACSLLLGLLAAYLITLNFFSGLPNALQIYLMPPFLYFLFGLKDPAVPSRVSQKNTSTPKIS